MKQKQEKIIGFPCCLTSPSRASAQRVLSLENLQYVKFGEEKNVECRKFETFHRNSILTSLGV